MNSPALDPQALAILAFRLGEFLGSEAPVVLALKEAAETADAEAAARAWDLLRELPEEFRQAAAKWVLATSKAREDIEACSDGERVLPFPLHKVL